MKTSELSGAALNWAVELCEGIEFLSLDSLGEHQLWEDCGPIIEREGMGVWMYQWNERGEPENGWYAEDKNGDHVRTGTTPLIAAMRCYVASKLGDEVQIPEGL